MTPSPHVSGPTQGAASPAHTGLRGRPALRDALYAVLFMFPAAALVTVLYHFPLPFGGTVRGPSGAWDAMLATLVYGLVGGFVAVPLVAAGLGLLLRRRGLRGHPAIRALPSMTAALLYAIVAAALG